MNQRHSVAPRAGLIRKHAQRSNATVVRGMLSAHSYDNVVSYIATCYRSATWRHLSMTVRTSGAGLSYLLLCTFPSIFAILLEWIDPGL
jgi:hypothetical protein